MPNSVSEEWGIECFREELWRNSHERKNESVHIYITRHGFKLFRLLDLLRLLPV